METHVGNLLDVQQGVIAHGTNARGAFGAGIAKSIKEKWPFINGAYSNFLSTVDVYKDAVGSVFWQDVTIFVAKRPVEQPRLLIANLVTQETYGRDPKVRYVSYDAVESCFKEVKRYVIEQDREELFDIHFPLIGAGLGNGSWRIISGIIESVFEDDKRFKLHLWVLPGTVIPKD